MWPTDDKTEELLVDAKDGDQDAVNRLIERHREAVLRMVQMRLDQKIRRRVDVSDVVQDVMIDASRRLQDFPEASPPRCKSCSHRGQTLGNPCLA